MKKIKDPAEALGLNEHQIEAALLEWLSTVDDGYPCKIVNNGDIKKLPDGRVILIPQQNKFFRKGMSDILFIHRKKTFWFEVKIYKDWDFIDRRKDWLRKELHTDKNYIRWQNQIIFQDEMRKRGHIAEFVYSLQQVKFQILRII